MWIQVKGTGWFQIGMAGGNVAGQVQMLHGPITLASRQEVLAYTGYFLMFLQERNAVKEV